MVRHLNGKHVRLFFFLIVGWMVDEKKKVNSYLMIEKSKTIPTAKLTWPGHPITQDHRLAKCLVRED